MGNCVTALHKDCSSNSGNKGEWRTVRACGERNPYVCKLSNSPALTTTTTAVETTATAAATTATLTTTTASETTTTDLMTTTERPGTSMTTRCFKKTELNHSFCQMNGTKISLFEGQNVGHNTIFPFHVRE